LPHLTAESLRCPPKADVLLAQPKISDLDVPVLIKQQVLQFQVAVDDVVRVQIAAKTCESSDGDLFDISVVVAEENLLKERRETTRRK
jgi:hypothetical protein